MEEKFKFIESPAEQISNIKDFIFRIISNWQWFVFLPHLTPHQKFCDIQNQRLPNLRQLTCDKKLPHSATWS